MTVAAFPEDSILRRHAETERQRLGVPPTDSILRRHYDQLQSAAPAAAASPVRSATVTPINRPQPAAAPAREAQPAQGGGLLGWLKRLLSA